jgi:hypothetical protein
MIIRNTTDQDFERVMEIYAYARKKMAEHGNPNQWGAINWPPADLILKDIQEQKSFVCEDEGKVIGVFFYDYGKDIEPTYRVLENGEWASNQPYGVVHRIAADGSKPGIGTFCINWAFEQCKNLRIDTHSDNKIMQNLLTKLGFEQRGIIYVVEDNDPRLAYEKNDSTLL